MYINLKWHIYVFKKYYEVVSDELWCLTDVEAKFPIDDYVESGS